MTANLDKPAIPNANVLSVLDEHLMQLCVETPEDQDHYDAMVRARATVEALVEALKTAREYVREHIASQRMHFGGYEGVSGIAVSESHLAQIDAALLAAGEVL